jgi:hypothetical protein
MGRGNPPPAWQGQRRADRIAMGEDPALVLGRRLGGDPLVPDQTMDDIARRMQELNETQAAIGRVTAGNTRLGREAARLQAQVMQLEKAKLARRGEAARATWQSVLSWKRILIAGAIVTLMNWRALRMMYHWITPDAAAESRSVSSSSPQQPKESQPRGKSQREHADTMGQRARAAEDRSTKAWREDPKNQAAYAENVRMFERLKKAEQIADDDERVAKGGSPHRRPQPSASPNRDEIRKGQEPHGSGKPHRKL